VSNLHATNTCVGPDIPSTTLIVTATEPDDGVYQVTVSWMPPGASYKVSQMTYAGSNSWHLNIAYNAAWSGGYIAYTVTAVDHFGNTSNALYNDNLSDTNHIQVAPSDCIIF
jgi:hypothetical protein